MSRETDAILQSLLYQLEHAKTLEDARNAVRAMCTKENIDAVKALLADEKK
jgi:hypothetical protein